jgi:signal transduction histidine kinase
VALACTVSATLGVASLDLAGLATWEQTAPIWVTWWLGDVGGALIVAPFLLVWSGAPLERPDGGRLREGLALLASVVLAGWVVFHVVNPLALGVSLKFLCVPSLIWAAFRFGPRVCTAVIVLLSALAVWGTLGRLSHSESWQLNLTLLVVQVFLSVMAVTTLALAAVVAERRRAANAAQATSARLDEAFQQLETFSHAISHDLRSPVSTVLNCVDLLEEDHGPRLGAQGGRLLQLIRAAAGSAGRLIDQLGQHAQRWPRQAERSVVDMTALAREVCDELASLQPAAEDVRFELHELPPALGSPVLLERVFRNLLGNAVKFTRGRHPRHITVTGLPGGAEHTYLVSDNGIGFAPGEASLLFRPFRRLRGARDIEGLGVGLAVVARIVRRHGGRVWAESDGTSGARFGFTLRNEEGRS